VTIKLIVPDALYWKTGPIFALSLHGTSLSTRALRFPHSNCGNFKSLRPWTIKGLALPSCATRSSAAEPAFDEFGLKMRCQPGTFGSKGSARMKEQVFAQNCWPICLFVQNRNIPAQWRWPRLFCCMGYTWIAPLRAKVDAANLTELTFS
jgi:hypothetical protein